MHDYGRIGPKPISKQSEFGIFIGFGLSGVGTVCLCTFLKGSVRVFYNEKHVGGKCITCTIPV
jgi:hypothetical protein